MKLPNQDTLNNLNLLHIISNPATVGSETKASFPAETENGSISEYVIV